MKYLIALISTGLLFSCLLIEGKKTISSPLIVHDSLVTPSFFDSVAAKDNLSIEQIKAHTTIDSIYYTDLYSGANFAGDTVLRLHNDNIGVIINYNDGRNCSFKWLLIFPAAATISSDYKKIETDCDRDFSGHYYYTRYKLLGDSCIETKEYHIFPNNDDDDVGRIWERIKYRINQKGLLDTVLIKECDQ